MMNSSVADEQSSGQCAELILQHFKQVYPLEQWKMEGFFEDDDVRIIDCHWMAFEPVRPSAHFLLAFIYIVVFLVGFLSNGLIIYVISSSKTLLTPSNILQVNLAVSDLIIVLTIPVFIFNSFHRGPAAGKLGCSIYGFLTGLSGTCSIMSLAGIAVERYLVISRPLSGDVDYKMPTRRWASFVSLLTWLYSAIFASMPFLGVGKYVPEGYLTSCSFDYLSSELTSKIFILVFFFGAWVVPLTIAVFSYVFIIRAVSRVRRNASEILSANTEDARAVPTLSQPDVDLEIFKTVLSLIGTWTVAWTPYAVVALIGISGHGHLLTPLSVMLPALFAKLATCVDPFIYTLSQPKIRTQVLIRLHLLPHTNTSLAPYYYPGLVDSRPHFNSRLGMSSHREPISGFSRSATYNNRSPSLIDCNHIRDSETNVKLQNSYKKKILTVSESPKNLNIDNATIEKVDVPSVNMQSCTSNSSEAIIRDLARECGDHRPTSSSDNVVTIRAISGNILGDPEILIVEQHPAPGVDALITISDSISNSTATVGVCIQKETLV